MQQGFNPDREPASIACEVCLKEIPHEKAMSSEVEGYVAYFCGTACYAIWNEEQVEAELERDA